MKAYLLRLVHYVIALAEFMRYLVMLVPSHAYLLLLAKKSALSIQADSKSLKRLPVHVGFLIAEDEFSFRDLANMIVWAVSIGISHISVYDINGEIKRNSFDLQRNVEVVKSEVMGDDEVNYDIQLYSSFRPLQQSQPGYLKSNHIPVHLLCLEDGRRKIVGISQHLSEMVKAGSYNVSDIVPSSVDAFFQESMHSPDPDLCLKFGAVDSLLGFLPWQIRLTEIISLSSHRGITYKSFLSSLVRYGDTNQRFGK